MDKLNTRGLPKLNQDGINKLNKVMKSNIIEAIITNLQTNKNPGYTANSTKYSKKS